jgi:hypothetical protein
MSTGGKPERLSMMPGARYILGLKPSFIRLRQVTNAELMTPRLDEQDVERFDCAKKDKGQLSHVTYRAFRWRSPVRHYSKTRVGGCCLRRPRF